jgi:hypothetical protein
MPYVVLYSIKCQRLVEIRKKENMKIQFTMPNFIWTSDRVTREMNFIKIGYETHAHVSKKKWNNYQPLVHYYLMMMVCLE